MMTADTLFLGALMMGITLCLVWFIYRATLLCMGRLESHIRELDTKLDAVLAQSKDAHVS